MQFVFIFTLIFNIYIDSSLTKPSDVIILFSVIPSSNLQQRRAGLKEEDVVTTVTAV